MRTYGCGTTSLARPLPLCEADVTERVLHVTQPVVAGVPEVALGLAAHQVRAGFTVGLVCPPNADLAERARAKGVIVLSWPASRQPGPTLPREIRRLATLVRAFEPDLVHLHSSKAGLAGRLAIRGRYATVFHPHAWSFHAAHGPQAAFARAWERFAGRWTDRLVAVSQAELDEGRAVGVATRASVVHNGVDTTWFAPSEPAARAAFAAEHGLAGRRIVVCVGRLCEQKGQDLALRRSNPRPDAWPISDTFAPGRLCEQLPIDQRS